MTWDSIRDHLIQSIAAATLLGGGAMLVNGSVDNAKQDTRIERLERLDDRLETIQKDVSETRETVARLEAKIEE
jgi:chaperonin cofactor prefoldin